MGLLLRTGLRIGELADLNVSDVRLTQRTGELVVRHGKGDRRRVVPLSRSAKTVLRAWLTDRERHPSQPAREEGRRGCRVPASGCRCARCKIVAAVMAAAGVLESGHGLRHTVATRLVRDRGRDLALVADILGHADVKTTRRYARSELEDRRAALEALER